MKQAGSDRPLSSSAAGLACSPCVTAASTTLRPSQPLAPATNTRSGAASVEVGAMAPTSAKTSSGHLRPWRGAAAAATDRRRTSAKSSRALLRDADRRRGKLKGPRTDLLEPLAPRLLAGLEFEAAQLVHKGLAGRAPAFQDAVHNLSVSMNTLRLLRRCEGQEGQEAAARPAPTKRAAKRQRRRRPQPSIWRPTVVHPRLGSSIRIA